MSNKKPTAKNSIGSPVPGGGLQDMRASEITRPLSKGGKKSRPSNPRVNSIGRPVPAERV